MASAPGASGPAPPSPQTASSSTTKIRHNSMQNRHAPLGHDYEMNILTLACLHSWNKTKENVNSIHKTESFIGAEVKDVWPFEDVVHTEVLQGHAKSVFLQAKHCDEESILKSDNLFSPGRKAPFSILKYFKSYRDIVKDYNPCKKFQYSTKIDSQAHEFVLFTNWTLDESDVKGLELLPQTHLFFMVEETENKLFRVQIVDEPDTLYRQAKEKIKAAIPGVDEDEIKHFFQHFVLAVNQPGVPQLKKLIEEKLSKITGLKDTEWMASTLLGKLCHWSHQKDGWYLTNQGCGEFFEYINQHLANWRYASLTSMKIDSVLQYGARFKQSAGGVLKQLQDFLPKTNSQQIAVIHYEELILTEIKVAQAIETTQYEAMLCDLTTLKEDGRDCSLNPLKAFSSKGSNHLLIVVRKYSELDDQKRIIEEFLNILADKDNHHKKLIFIIPSKLRGTVSHIIGDNHSVFNDNENCFSDLEDTSQDYICKLRTVIFESCKVRLGAIINDLLKHKMSGEMLANIIKGDIIIQDVPRDEEYEDAKEYYFPLELYRRVTINNEIRLSNEDFDIIQEPFVDFKLTKEDIVLITKTKDPKDKSAKFQELCNEYKNCNIHWLLEDFNSLFWKQTQGSVKKLRQYATTHNSLDNVDDGDIEVFSQFDRDERCTVQHCSDIQDKMVVIRASPGMGKSLFLSHIAHQTRAQNNRDGGAFVVKVNLRDHHKCTNLNHQSAERNTISLIDLIFNANEPEKQGCLNNFLEMADDQIQLAETCQNLEILRLLQITTFINFYNQKQMVIMLDGFDEIAPDHTEKFINLLKTLVNSNVKSIWVTTRPCNILHEIENTLNTFPYSLQGFWKSREKFIDKYLNCKVKCESDFGDCEKRIDKLKRVMKLRILDRFMNNVSFLSIPMHAQMTVDIYIEDVKSKLSANSTEHVDDIEMIRDMNVLYKKCTETKLEKLIASLGRDLSLLGIYDKIIRERAIENHRKLALLDLFPDDSLTKEMVPEKEREELVQNVLSSSEKTGLVVPVRDGTPRFVHRTFAEYYAADLLADQIRMGPGIQSDRAKKFLYKLITTDTYSTYQELFSFFNYNIVADNENYRHFVAILSGSSDGSDISDVENVRDVLGRTPLHFIYCVNENKSIKKSFLEKNKRTLLSSDELFHWTPLHYAALMDEDVPYDLQSETTLSASSLQDVCGRTPLMLSLRSKVNNASHFMFEIPYTYSAEDCDKNTLLHYSCSLPSRSLFPLEELLKVDADFLKANNKGETPLDLLLETGTEDDFKHIANHKSVIIKEFIKKTQDRNKIVKLMSKCEYVMENNLVNIGLTDDTGKSALHHVCIAGDLYMAKFLLQLPEVVNLINRPDGDQKTPLHYAAASCQLQLIKLLLKYNADVDAEDKCDKKPAQLFFESERNLKILDSSLHLPFPDDLELFFSSILTQANINNILVPVIGKYKNIQLYFMCKQLIKRDISDNKGRTALHYAVASGNVNIVGRLLGMKADVYKPDNEGNIPVDLLFEGNLRSLQAFDDKLRYDNGSKSLETLLPLLLSLAKVSKQKRIPALGYYKNIALVLYIGNVLDVNEYYEGKTALHYAVINCLDDNVDFLIQNGAYFDTVSEEFVDTNKSLRFIAELFRGVKENKLDKVMFALNEIRSFEIVNLRSKDNGKTPLHFAMETNNKEIITYLLSRGAFYNVPDKNGVIPSAVTSDSEVLQALTNTDELFKAIEHGDLSRVQNCIENGALVNARDYYREGMQPLHLAVKRGFGDVVDALLQNQADVYGKVDSTKATVLHLVCECDRVDIFESVVEYFTREKSVNIIFLCTDTSGNAPLQIAVREGNINIIRFILNRFNFEMVLSECGWALFTMFLNIGKVRHSNEKQVHGNNNDEIKKLINEYFRFEDILIQKAAPLLHKFGDWIGRSTLLRSFFASD